MPRYRDPTMFTGLVQAVGRVRASLPTPRGVRLRIDAAGWDHRPAIGDSISIAGVCLTVASPPEHPGNLLEFDAVAETLSKTTLGALREGDAVNLEHACRADTLLGGHIVQGHIDAVGRIARANPDPADWRLSVEPPPALMEFVAPMGSIAIDGVSLTVASVDPRAGRFDVALIPTTLEKTTLAALREGAHVNLEADCVAKQIVWWMKNYARR